MTTLSADIIHFGALIFLIRGRFDAIFTFNYVQPVNFANLPLSLSI